MAPALDRSEQRDASRSKVASLRGYGWGRPAVAASPWRAGIFPGSGGRRAAVLARWLGGILQALSVRSIACALHCLWEEDRDSLGI